MTALLSCEFTLDQGTHKAVIVDISLKGAFLSAKLRPPEGSIVKIALQSSHLKKPLTLDGKVIRGESGWSEHANAGKFAVRFLRPEIGLIDLINGLVANRGLIRRV